MVYKSKRAKKVAVETAQQLQECKVTIQQLEQQLHETQATTEGASTVRQSVINLQALQEYLKAQKAIAQKAKNVGTVAETKVDRLRAKLRQSSDRKASIRATIRKSINELKARLDGK